MAHQHGGPWGKEIPHGDHFPEGQEILLLEGFQGPLVHGNARVGVPVVPVAGEVLQHAAQAIPGLGPHHPGDKVEGLPGVPACGPVVDKIARIGGHVRHRGQVHVEAQGLEEQGLLPGLLLHRPHFPAVIL